MMIDGDKVRCLKLLVSKGELMYNGTLNDHKLEWVLDSHVNQYRPESMI